MKTYDITTQQHISDHIQVAGDIDIVYNIRAGAQLDLQQITTTKENAKENAKDSTKINITYNLEQGATLNVNTLDIDNKLLHRTQTFNLIGTGASANATGLYITADGEKSTNNIKMNHLNPNCTSSQTYKGLVGGVSEFLGHIFIEKDAQHTQALQQNHNILLNPSARVISNPWLEIYADDVKCNHGATVGKNDPDAIYYLRQRGIPELDAKKLMLEAFIDECVMNHPSKDELLELISAKLKTL